MQMKKFFAMAAATLLLASCSNDDFNVAQDGQEVTVNVTATLPADMQSRAFSDGEKALDMYYAVYEDGVDAPIIALNKHTQQFSGLQNTLTLHLVTGKTYNVVFWAQSPKAKNSDGDEYFTLDTQNSTVTVNYDAIKYLNVEDVDAFFCNKSIPVTGAASITAELKRPFAQINVGTSDINEAGLSSKTLSTTMSVSSVYESFDLKDGKVIGNPTTTAVPFAETVRPNQGKGSSDTDYENFPVGTPGQYEYLAMAYVLMGTDKMTTDVELAFYDGGTKFHELSVPGAPVQRNYRTNIFGALLTSTIDFTININPIYDGNYFEEITVEPLTPDPVTGIYTVSTAEELMSLGVTFTDDIVAGKSSTVEITSDIDMSGYTFVPPFAYLVNIKGNGHTIKNLNITQNENGRAGFVAYLGGGSISDLVLENVTVEGREAGIIAGQNEGGKVNNVTIKGDCSVSFLDEVPSSWYDSEWDGIGAIFGLNAENSSGSITIDSDCTIKLYHNGLSNTTSRVNAYDEYTYYLDGKKNNPTITNNGSIVSVWDGQQVTALVVDGAYQVVCPGNWAWLAAKFVIKGIDSNMNILCDLDFNDGVVQPMFHGKTIYGNNKTIANFSLGNKGEGRALFTHFGFTISDLTIKNVTCKQDLSGGYSDQWMGVLGGIIQDGCTINMSNIVVDGADLNGTQSVGGFIGKAVARTTITINNCVLKNSTIQNQYRADESGFVAAFVGCSKGVVQGSNNSTQNVAVKGIYCAKRGEQSIQKFVGYYSTDDITSINLLDNPVWGADCTFEVINGDAL